LHGLVSPLVHARNQAKEDCTQEHLEYFRWYPKDAEVDDKYSKLTFEARGFYHTCLNYEWINGSIPKDPVKFHRAFPGNRLKIDRLWNSIQYLFEAKPDTNPDHFSSKRLEEQRVRARVWGGTVSRYPEFNAFFAAWPEAHRTGVDQAAMAWVSTVNGDAGEVMAGLERWKSSDQWSRGFVQRMDNWLLQRMWKDNPQPIRKHKTKIEEIMDRI